MQSLIFQSVFMLVDYSLICSSAHVCPKNLGQDDLWLLTWLFRWLLKGLTLEKVFLTSVYALVTLAELYFYKKLSSFQKFLFLLASLKNPNNFISNHMKIVLFPNSVSHLLFLPLSLSSLLDFLMRQPKLFKVTVMKTSHQEEERQRHKAECESEENNQKREKSNSVRSLN